MGAKDKVMESLLEALQDKASKGFTLSQERCPVKSGGLKGSGSIEHLPDKSIIHYSKEYASNVERGVEDHTESVRGHMIGRKYIRSHTRHIKAREGIHFIENSLKEAFKELNNSVDSELRIRFSNVTKS